LVATPLFSFFIASTVKSNIVCQPIWQGLSIWNQGRLVPPKTFAQKLHLPRSRTAHMFQC
jgi:hypothetical protein